MLVVWPGQTARRRERLPLNREAEDRRRRGRRMDGAEKKVMMMESLTASGSPIEKPFDHPKVLRSGPEHSPLESARCLISGHANEIRCASKDELADTKPLKK